MSHAYKSRIYATKEHLNVLIVEDDHTYRMIAYESMHNFGPFNIHKTLAENAQKAREAFTDIQPDITLLDINLPDGNGLDLLEEFRKINPQAFIVMVTHSSDVEDVSRARAGGHPAIF